MYPEIGDFIIRQLDGSSKLAQLDSTPEQAKLEIDHVEADIKAALNSRTDADEAENDLLLRNLTVEELVPNSSLNRYDYSEQLQDLPPIFPYPYRRWVV